MDAYFTQWFLLAQEVGRGGLALLRGEYVHLLYRLGLHIVKYMFEAPQESVSRKEFIADIRAHFNGYPRYQAELEYLQRVYEGPWEPRVLKEDARFLAVFSTNQVVLSRYAAQALQLFLEKHRLHLVHNFVTGSSQKRYVLVSDNIALENYVGRAALAAEDHARDLARVNREPLALGLPREHYNHLCKLEDLAWRKRNPGEKGGAAAPPGKYPMEKAASSFLAGAPEPRSKFLVDFSKDYVNRLGAAGEASLLGLRLRDPGESVTAVELASSFKLVLLGLASGACRVVYLSQDSKLEAKEEYARENQQFSLGADLSRADGAPPTVANHLTALGQKGLEGRLALPTAAVECVGHSAVVTSLSLAYDSFSFLSASADASVRLWNCRTGLCLAVYRAHLRSVWSVRFSPRGFFFASGGAERVVFLWSTLKPQPVRRLLGHADEVVRVEFTKNLLYAVTASTDRTVRFWAVEDGAEVRVFYFENQLTCFEVNETADTLLAGDVQGELVIWDVERYALIARVAVNASEALRGLCLAYDEHQLLVYTASDVAFFDFNRLRQPRSRDVYKKFEGKAEEAEQARPLWRLSRPGLDVLAAAFTHRNVGVCVFRPEEAAEVRASSSL